MAFKVANNKGFGLVEVVITLSIIGVASAAILSLITTLSGHMRSADSKAAELVLANEINQVISEEERCTKAVTEVGLQSLDTTKPFKLKLKLPSSGDFYEGAKLGSNLEVKEFFIDAFAPASTEVEGQKRVTGTLWLKTTDVAANAMPRKRRSLGTISLLYKNGTNHIVGCFSQNVDPELSCKSLGLNWNSGSKTCRQPASISCEDIGGSWVNDKCIISHVSNNVSIVGKSCSGNNVALVGFDGGGNPICKAITASNSGGSSGGGGGGTSVASTDPVKAGCRGGNTNVASPDGSNQCYFEWGSVAAGAAIVVGDAYLHATNGGIGRASCKGNDQWDYTYACPNGGPGAENKTVCGGGYVTVKSTDGSNSCTFQWGQASVGQSIKISGTNGGALSGTCKAGVGWEYGASCPSKVATQPDCPGGGLSYGKCYFVWDQTPSGQSARNLRDVSGRGGTASGIICKAGSWDTSGHKVSGACN